LTPRPSQPRTLGQVAEIIRKGKRLRVASECEVTILTHWRAPFTGGLKCVPKVGTILVVDSDQREGFPGFGCVPEDYKGFEAVYVPSEDRSNPKYDGYHIVALASEIGKSLELIA
jgi:hypothetical protein